LQELTKEELLKTYDWVGDPQEERRRVRKDGKWFHILLNGSPAYFNKRFFRIRDFHEGLALVCEGAKGPCYHILLNGQPAYSERFDDGSDFKNGRALMSENNEPFHIWTDGKRIY
jgi:hypothetical protein